MSHSKGFRGICCVWITVFVLGAAGCAMGSATGEYTVKGDSALEAGEYQEAQTAFETAVSEGEQQMLAYRGLGLADMGLADYEGAAAAFQKALAETDDRMRGNTEDLRLYLATAQYRMRDYEDVILTCGDLLEETEGGNADAYFLRGASYLIQGDTESAKKDFDAAVALTPEDYDLYLNIYECYEQMNLSGIGADYLQSALEIKGESTEYEYNQGRVYYYLGNYEQAQQELSGPVKEEYEPAMYLIGKVYLALDDYDHAIAIYRQIEESFGQSPECSNGLALCAMQDGDYDAALEYIEQGLQMDGDANARQELYFNEIIVYEKKLDFETAREKAQAYAKAYPSDEAGQKEWEFLSSR